MERYRQREEVDSMNVIVIKHLVGYDPYELIKYLKERSNIYIYNSGNTVKKIKSIFVPMAKSVFCERLMLIYEGCTGLLHIRLLWQTNLFLNHGWGTKRSPGILEMRSKKIVSSWRLLRKRTDYVICYSDFDSTYFFRHELLDDLPLPKFVPLGHPRNDFLVRMKDDSKFISEKKKQLGIPEGAKVILFAPTQRESAICGGTYDEDILNLHLSELQEINKFCAERDTYILYRPHYSFKDEVQEKLSNVIFVTAGKEPDPRPLMLISDVLITDYSSIFVDYLLLQKPIMFYQPDLELYQNKLRGLVIDPDNPMHFPGPKLKKLSDILDLTPSDFKEFDLQKSRAFFHKYHDDKSMERLASFIKSIAES